jgi:fructosamine-3-kinase
MGDFLPEIVARELGTAITAARPLSGGCIGEVSRLDLADGRRIVAKVDRGGKPRLEIEGYMLRYLREHSALPVPEVLWSEPKTLLMTFEPGESHFSARGQAHAAELLAALHSVAASACGLERDTLIGGLHQPNPNSKSWIDFFREQRLLHMARLAHREGHLPATLLARLERFAADLEKFIAEPPHPSLLHGDVWTTNVLAENHRITAFLDPAIYYGHPEVELAFTTLFGTFGPAFFEAYDAIRPIAPGFFEVRRDIYNLYPLLVHVRLFGSSYLGGITATLARHGY